MELSYTEECMYFVNVCPVLEFLRLETVGFAASIFRLEVSRKPKWSSYIGWRFV